jgi:hypothetical protein
MSSVKTPPTINLQQQHPRRREEAAAAPAGTTNMLLHGIEVPSQIRHDNTLEPPAPRLRP